MKLKVCTIILAIGALGAAPVFSQTTATTTPPPTTDSAAPAYHGHHLSFLTPQEKEQLKNDRHQVLTNNASLKAEAEALKQEHQSLKSSGTSDPTARKAFHQKMRTFEGEMQAAILQLDPSAKPIFDKIAAHHQAKANHSTGTPGTPQS